MWDDLVLPSKRLLMCPCWHGSWHNDWRATRSHNYGSDLEICGSLPDRCHVRPDWERTGRATRLDLDQCTCSWSLVARFVSNAPRNHCPCVSKMYHVRTWKVVVNHTLLLGIYLSHPCISVYRRVRQVDSSSSSRSSLAHQLTKAITVTGSIINAVAYIGHSSQSSMKVSEKGTIVASIPHHGFK